MEKKPVPGYEDEYYLDPEVMQVINVKTGRPKQIRPDGAGYAEVQLYKNNKREHKNVHRLFAEAYIPNPNNLPEINHIDEDPMNYSLDNLEWCTHKYNLNYGTAQERRSPKISEALKGRSCSWVAEQKGKPVIGTDPNGNETLYPSANEADRQLGLSRGSINNVLCGRQKTAAGRTWRRA